MFSDIIFMMFVLSSMLGYAKFNSRHAKSSLKFKLIIVYFCNSGIRTRGWRKNRQKVTVACKASPGRKKKEPAHVRERVGGRWQRMLPSRRSTPAGAGAFRTSVPTPAPLRCVGCISDRSMSVWHLQIKLSYMHLQAASDLEGFLISKGKDRN